MSNEYFIFNPTLVCHTWHLLPVCTMHKSTPYIKGIFQSRPAAVCIKHEDWLLSLNAQSVFCAETRPGSPPPPSPNTTLTQPIPLKRISCGEESLRKHLSSFPSSLVVLWVYQKCQRRRHASLTSLKGGERRDFPFFHKALDTRAAGINLLNGRIPLPPSLLSPSLPLSPFTVRVCNIFFCRLCYRGEVLDQNFLLVHSCQTSTFCYIVCRVSSQKSFRSLPFLSLAPNL